MQDEFEKGLIEGWSQVLTEEPEFVPPTPEGKGFAEGLAQGRLEAELEAKIRAFQATMADKANVAEERRKLYEQLQMVCAGHSVEACLGALTDSLASMIAFSAEDPSQAERIVDLTGVDLKGAIRDNWDYVREIRAQSGLGSAASN